MELTVKTITSGPRVVVTVAIAGEIDLATAPALQAQLIEACRAPARALVVDLENVSFCGSLGLAVFLTVAKQLRATGCDFTLAKPTPSVRRLLEITKLTAHFGLSDASSDAGGGSTQLDEV